MPLKIYNNLIYDNRFSHLYAGNQMKTGMFGSALIDKIWFKWINRTLFYTRIIIINSKKKIILLL